jgi:hypothetical protein
MTAKLSSALKKYLDLALPIGWAAFILGLVLDKSIEPAFF